MDKLLSSRRIQTMVISVILTIAITNAGCSNKDTNIVTYNFDTYQSESTDFNKNISTVLPPKEDLKDQRIVFYLFYDNGKTDESSAASMIRMTVEYTDTDFVNAASEIEEQYLKYQSPSTSSRFYYDGVLYNGFMFTDNGYCAVAYHICQDSKTISYIAFDCWDLQFMDVESALKHFIQYEYNNQIVSY